ncbi:MAG: biopolymer transporter ExbD [Aquabacterium sp.]|uniref:biopolymer transporter ExbD n=1 Tax=Aquabacterium sp. TaxID=1872578 RepID=UPI0025BE609F|nr:biopolymer transporter ExbD [Aquabacterium sp.]MBI5925195.1 biopolymer transporter ExbD [Aquabacterium sp.]
MAELNARGGGRRRRTRNEINMVPFIDVMLVLLIIFMVSAPLLPTGVVDLPSIGKARKAPEKVIEVVLEDDEHVKLRVNRKDAGEMLVKDLAERIKPMQDEAAGGPEAVPVIISARKDVRYESVVHVMDVLQKAGVARVGLSVRTTGG